MKTSSTDILKQFQTVLNRKILTEQVYQRLLEKWDLDDVDLDEEMLKINMKKSGLTRSRRDAVPEFIKLREILKEQKQEEAKAMSLTNEGQPPLYQDTIIN